MKVCFLSWHYESPELFLETLIKMTPNCSGKWKDMVAVTDANQADFCLVMDGYSEKFPRERALYFGQHPNVPGGFSPSFRTFEDTKCLKAYPLSKHLNPGEWWISHTYDELSALKPTEKLKKLACAMTYQHTNAMYKQRWEFMREFVNHMESAVELDLYGRPQENFESDEILKPVYKGVLGKNNPDGTKGEHLIGKEVIGDYRYSLEFDVGPTENYFSERFYDALFLWTMPIYFGSNNVHDFIPENAFRYVNISDPETYLQEIEKVSDIINSDFREQNLDAIAEARDLLLNKYQTWPYVYNKIKEL